MINLEAYLSSGIIENYCLGSATAEEAKQLLFLCKEYPALSRRLNETQRSLEKYIHGFEKKAPADLISTLKFGISENEKMNQVKFIESTNELSNYFEITRHTDVVQLQSLIKNISAPEYFENEHLHPLYQSDDKLLGIIWLKDKLPPETHADIEECFIVLNGSVDCIVEEEVIKLKKGDFMRMPLGKEHTIVVTSDQMAKAVVTRVSIA